MTQSFLDYLQKFDVVLEASKKAGVPLNVRGLNKPIEAGKEAKRYGEAEPSKSDFTSMVYIEPKAKKNTSAYSTRIMPTTGNVHEFLRDLFNKRVPLSETEEGTVEHVVNMYDMDHYSVKNEKTGLLSQPESKKELITVVKNCLSNHVNSLLRGDNTSNSSSLPLSLIYLALGFLLTEEQLEEGLDSEFVKEILKSAESRNREDIRKIADYSTDTQVEMIRSFSFLPIPDLAKELVEVRERLARFGFISNEALAAEDLYKALTNPTTATSDINTVTRNIFYSLVSNNMGIAALPYYDLNSDSVKTLLSSAGRSGRSEGSDSWREVNKTQSIADIDSSAKKRASSSLYSINIFSNTALDHQNQLEEEYVGSKYLHPHPVHENAKRKLAREIAKAKKEASKNTINIIQAVDDTKHRILSFLASDMAKSELKSEVEKLLNASNLTSLQKLDLSVAEASLLINSLKSAIAEQVNSLYAGASRPKLAAELIRKLQAPLTKLNEQYSLISKQLTSNQGQGSLSSLPKEVEKSFLEIIENADQNGASLFLKEYHNNSEMDVKIFDSHLRPVLESLLSLSPEEAKIVQSCLININNASPMDMRKQLLQSLDHAQSKLSELLLLLKGENEEDPQKLLPESFSSIISSVLIEEEKTELPSQLGKSQLTLNRILRYIDTYILSYLNQDFLFKKEYEKELGSFSSLVSDSLSNQSLSPDIISQLKDSIETLISLLHKSIDLTEREKITSAGYESLGILAALNSNKNPSTSKYFAFLLGDAESAGAISPVATSLIKERENITKIRKKRREDADARIKELLILPSERSREVAKSTVDLLLDREKTGGENSALLFRLVSKIKALMAWGVQIHSLSTEDAKSTNKLDVIKKNIEKLKDELLNEKAKSIEALDINPEEFEADINDLVYDALSGSIDATYSKTIRKHSASRVYNIEIPGLFERPVPVKEGILSLYSNLRNINLGTIEILLEIRQFMQQTPQLFSLLKEGNYDDATFEQLIVLLEPITKSFCKRLTVIPPEKTAEGVLTAKIVNRTLSERLAHTLIDLYEAGDLTKIPVVVQNPDYTIPLGIESCNFINLAATIDSFSSTDNFSLLPGTDKNDLLYTGFMQSIAPVASLPKLIISDPNSVAALHYTVFSIIAKNLYKLKEEFSSSDINEIVDSFTSGIGEINDGAVSNLKNTLNEIINAIYADSIQVSSFCSSLENILLEEGKNKVSFNSILSNTSGVSDDTILKVAHEYSTFKSPDDIVKYGKKLLSTLPKYSNNSLIKSIISNEENVFTIFKNALEILIGFSNYKYIVELYDSLVTRNNKTVIPVDKGIFIDYISDNSVYNAPNVRDNKMLLYLYSLIKNSIEDSAIKDRLVKFAAKEDSEEWRLKKEFDPLGTARTVSEEFIVDKMSFMFQGADTFSEVDKLAKNPVLKIEEPTIQLEKSPDTELSIEERGKIVLAKSKIAAAKSQTLSLAQFSVPVSLLTNPKMTGIRNVSTTKAQPLLTRAKGSAKTYAHSLKEVITIFTSLIDTVAKFNPDMQSDLRAFKQNCSILQAALNKWTFGENMHGSRETIELNSQLKQYFTEMTKWPININIFDYKKTGLPLNSITYKAIEDSLNLSLTRAEKLNGDSLLNNLLSKVKEAYSVETLADDMQKAYFDPNLDKKNAALYEYKQLVTKLISSGSVTASSPLNLKLSLIELLRTQVLKFAIIKTIPVSLVHSLERLNSVGLLFLVKENTGITTKVAVRFFDFNKIISMMNSLATPKPDIEEPAVERTSEENI